MCIGRKRGRRYIQCIESVKRLKGMLPLNLEVVKIRNITCEHNVEM